MPSDADFDAVLIAIAQHGNVRQACRDAGIPNGTFYDRIAQDAEFGGRYVRAKASGCHAIADEMRELQSEEPPQVRTQFDAHVDAGWVQWQRNKIELDKWLLARLLPKVYGDRTIVAGDADNPVHFVDDSAVAGKLLPELAGGDSPSAPRDTDET